MQVIGDTFGVDISTVSRVISSVTDLLFRLKDRVIKFPVTDIDRRRAMKAFYAVRGFPSVIGCIDGTHVNIISPGQPDEAAFVNRKHQHSINVQATCDHKGTVTPTLNFYKIETIFQNIIDLPLTVNANSIIHPL